MAAAGLRLLRRCRALCLLCIDRVMTRTEAICEVDYSSKDFEKHCLQKKSRKVEKKKRFFIIALSRIMQLR